MSQYLLEEIDGKENVDVRLSTQIVDAAGDERLESLAFVMRAARRPRLRMRSSSSSAHRLEPSGSRPTSSVTRVGSL